MDELVFAAYNYEMKVVILGLDGCVARHFIGMTQMFLASSRVITKDTGAPVCFEVLTASVDGKPFVDDDGRCFAVDADISSISSCDAVLLPGFAFDRRGESICAARAACLASWIRQRHEQGSLIGASCNGVFMLEATGILGRRCEAESCVLQDAEERCSSTVDAPMTIALIEENGAIAASGWLSWVDLTLYAIRALTGREAARRSTEPVASESLPAGNAAEDPSNLLIAAKALLSDAEQIIKGLGAERLTARGLANALGISPRTLYRRLKAATGESPRDFIDRIRFEATKALLATSAYPVKQLAARAGYADEASFRRAFLRRAGMTPGAYRTRVNSSVAS
jgi:transcriptional regulator GlxA family with amidase domain